MRSDDEMIAYALETPLALLDYIPELLTDLEELGGDAQAITGVIKTLDLSESATVVDLGCGKGAVAVEVADRLKLRVLGIDLFEPFVEHCKGLAESRGVTKLCAFIHGDILKLADTYNSFDIALYVALGDVLGPLDQAVSVIRQYVKPGGYIVISDGYIRDGGTSDFAGFEQYADHRAMIARLTACGDTLLNETIESGRHDGNNGELIMKRAISIAARRPELAADLLEYAKTQVAEYKYLEDNFVCAIWVLQRTH
jgi:SAM-dependent methyltransferase